MATVCTIVLAVSSSSGAEAQGGVPQDRIVAQDARRIPATTADAQQASSRKVTLVVRDSTLAYVVKSLAQQAKLRIGYDAQNALFAKRVSVEIRNTVVTAAFADVLKGTGFEAILAPDGETMVVRSISGGVPRDTTRSQGSITGRVTDSATGKGVGQVVVSVHGTRLSATSQESGSFRITDVPTGRHAVTARLLGYAARTVNVVVDSGKIASVVMVLRPMPTSLSEVVTTATGQQRRVELGNDITTVNADSVMAVAPVATVTDLLATRVPGLIVLPSSGLPGSSSRIRLRGMSSLSTSNDPIVVIDGVRMYADQSGDKLGGNVNATGTGGVLGIANSSGAVGGSSLRDKWNGPSPLDQLDPNSIATIEVFKGPSASAMYGPDAANGVIVITTKRGQSGPSRFEASATGGHTTLSGRWPVNYYRFGHSIQTSQTSSPAGGGSRICSAVERCFVDSLVAFQALHSSRLSPLESGIDRGLTLGVSGGRQAMTYALTGSASDRNGIFRLPPFVVERFAAVHNFPAPLWMRQPDTYFTAGGSGKVGLQIGTRGDVMLTTTMFYSKQQQPPDLTGVIRGLSTRYYDATNATAPDSVFGYLERVLFQSMRTTNTMQGTLRLTEWLPVNVVGGVDAYTTDNNSVQPRGYGLGYSIAGVPTDTTGSYGVTRGQTLMRTLNVSTVIPVPRVRVALGGNYSATSRTSFSAAMSGLPFGVMEPTQFNYQNGGPMQTIENRSTFGWYLAPTLHLTSRLFFNPGFRLDGSSTTGVRAGLAGLPKMDISWLAVDRSNGVPLFGLLTQLRPRIAAGVATVQPKAGNSLRLFAPGMSTLLGASTSVTTVSLTSLGNTQLKPERSREVEAGLDADLWNARMTISVSGYQKIRYDAIVAIPTAASVGDFNIAANIGTIRNQGMNASIGARLLDSRVIGWSVDATLTQNRGNVVSLLGGKTQVKVGGGGSNDGAGAIVFRPGYPPNAIFVPRIASYFDADGDGRISQTEVLIADDSVYMGAQEPTDQLDMRTGITVLNGRLQFNAALSYQHGMTQYRQIGLGAMEGLNDPSIPLGRQAEIMAACNIQSFLSSCRGGRNGVSQIGAYQRINLLRWQSVSVSWHVPHAVAARVGGSAMTVSLQGSNLGLRTNYRGKDPAVSRYATGNLVADSGQLPAPRVFQVRLTWQR